MIYRETARLLAEVEHRPVRLVGAGIYNLSGDSGRQMTLDDYMEDSSAGRQQIIDNKLKELGQRYHLDFAGNKDKIVRGDILYRTAEYMRKQSK